MSGFSDFAQNKIIDAYRRAQALGAPATLYFTILTCTKGARANTTVYALNDTVAVLANDAKYHPYKVTTAGATAAAQGSLYPGTVGEAITDGTAVLTEQSAAVDANTGLVEPTGGNYARVAVTASLTNFSGTQGAASTTASTGTTGITTNNAAITFPVPSAQWIPAGGAAWGYAVYDAAAAGNMWEWGPLVQLKTSIANGDPAPSWAAGVASFQLGY